MPTRTPDIIGLLTNRIDHLESNLTTQIHDVRTDLGDRISELVDRVTIQNGRVGKLEACVAKLEVEVEADLNKGMSKKRIAAIGAGGIISGAAIIEVIKWVGEGLHKAGLFG